MRNFRLNKGIQFLTGISRYHHKFRRLRNPWVIPLLAMTVGIVQPAHGLDRDPVLTPSQTQPEKLDGKNGFLYRFDPGSRRDPFRSLLDEANSEKIDRSSLPADLPEQKIHGMKLLGIVSGTEGFSALIQNSAGKRIFVTSGTMIEGKSLMVREITEDTLVLHRIPSDSKRQSEAGLAPITLSFSN